MKKNRPKLNRPYEEYINYPLRNKKKVDCNQNDVSKGDEADYHKKVELEYGEDVEDVLKTDEGYYLFYKNSHFIQRYNENTTKSIHIGKDEKDDKTRCECFYKRKGYFMTYGDFVVLDLKSDMWKIMMLPSRKIKYIPMKQMVKIYCKTRKIKPKDIRYLATDREKKYFVEGKGEFHFRNT